MLQNNNQSGAGETAAPIARNDVDALEAGSMGPETGSAISGAGTLTGATGADTITDGPGAIIALQGAGGADSSETGGSLQVDGQYGVLTLDAQGSYSYMRSSGTPDGVQDVFTYTLADADGQRDDATLTIQLLRDPTVESAELQVGPDGVVMLPAGVELADIRVIGRDLVVTLPDGSTMIIPGGAVFVPQLVIGDVEVPASNLAALLIESEPQPAAGTPQSSGGNFEVPVAPLDPGVPLGDLIPPTELDYTPPVFEDVGQIDDEEPEIFVQPDGQPASVNAVDSVDEAGLPPRDSEPQGSGEEAAAGANGDTSETTTGTIVVDSPDGPSVITVNGVAVTAVGQVIAGTYGDMTITSISDTAIGYSYTLNDNTAGDATEDNFSVSVTDNDGDVATATLTIDIIDDVPTARPDTDSIAAGEFGPATGNVMTDASAGDAEDGDNGRDTVGADDAELTDVSGAGDTTTNEGGDFVVEGEYGVLTIDSDGNYSYVRNEGTPGGVTDTFDYVITDGDGDTSTSTLTIDIGDLPVEVGENPTVLLDDDALENGNPGGVGDDPDAANLTGTLSGSGGDGDLTFSLETGGAPTGFTYVAGPDGSVLVQQGEVTVLTITVDSETGDYTVTQNAPIEHAEGDDENNVSFTIDYLVTDADGDDAQGSLTINVDDDTPEIGRVDISAPSLIVDETVLGTNDSGDFSTLFSVDYGADGAGTTSYDLVVVNGVDSGLTDVATGDPILLFDNNGVIEGRVGGEEGAVAFTVSVSGEGVVTLDQIRPLDHPNATDHDDSVSPIPSSIQLSVTATDADGDPVNETISIGGNLAFEDDGPSVTDAVAGDGVTLDETEAGSPDGFPISATSTGPAISAGTSFGADGAGTVAYGLSLPGGADSGLATAIGDHPITLVQVDSNTIEGRYEDGGTQVAFTIEMNADGTVTVTQEVPLEHLVDGSSAEAHDDALDLSGLVDATVTVTDRDGDTAAGSAEIGENIVFEDDGPTIDVTAGADGEIVLETQDADTIGIASDSDSSMADFSDVFGSTFDGGADGAAGTPDLSYMLGLQTEGGPSGLTQGGAPIYLYVIGTTVVGSTSATEAGVLPGNTVFDVTVNGDGEVTLTQYSQIDHPIADDPTATESPFADDVISLEDALVTLTASGTVTDNDGDTATDTATVNIGANLQFADDGPDVSAVLTGTFLEIDETDGETVGAEVDPVGGNLGTVTVAAATLFTVTEAHASADSPTDFDYALTISGQGDPSGLLLSTTDDPIFLYNIGGTVYGSTATDIGDVDPSNTAFTVSIDADTGAVTMTQFLAVEHFNTASHDEDSSGLDAGALTVTVTATDADDDTDAASVDLGSVIRFEDDGPTIDVTAGEDGEIVLETQDADTIGIASDSDSSMADFSDVFGSTFDGGADGAAGTPDLSYMLGLQTEGGASNLTQGGAPIYLYEIGGVIVGSTSNTELGVTEGNTVFDVTVNGDGEVTLTQYGQIDHPAVDDPDGTDAPFADDVISLDDELITLTASGTVTDNDEDTDTDTATVNIGANLQFADDGPIARADTDSTTEGGSTTGNVLTGVGTTSGNAGADSPGADGFAASPDGAVIGIASVNQSTSDIVADGAGNFVLAGEFGTLTLNRDGSYTYAADANTDPTEPDVFTYTVIDADGDTSTITLTITVQDVTLTPDNDTVTVNEAAMDTIVDPGDVAAGTVTGSNPGLTTESVDGQLAVAGATQYTLDSPAVGTYGTIELNADGSYTYTLTQPFDTTPSADNSTNTELGAEVFTYTAEDADGNTVQGTITINIIDDVPSVDVTEGSDAGVTLVTGDAGTIGVNMSSDFSSANFGSVFGLTFNAGADGAAATPDLSYTLDVTGFTGGPAGVDSGLEQGGDTIYLYEISGKVVGSTSATLGGVVAGNTVFDVSVDADGIVTLTQYSQIDHPTLDDPTATEAPFADDVISLTDSMVTLTANATITDNDGDTDTDSETVNIGANLQFTDDGPVAVDDPVSQGAENADVIVDVFANDSAGADGVDLMTGIAVVPGSLTGSGTLTYNGDGTFTYEPANNEEADVTFDYEITDADGDTDTATVTIDLQPDSTPAPDNEVASVDDEGLAFGITGGDGDLIVPNGDGDNDESTFGGTLTANFGGDAPGTFDFSAMDGTSGTVGTETVDYTLSGNVLTATVAASEDRAGTVLFTVSLTPATGAYTVTLVNNILHADEVANTENDATAVLTFTATDSELETANGTLTITFDDDMPVAFDPDPITTGLENMAGETETADLDVDGQIEDNVGADQPGIIQFANITDGDVSGFFSDEVAIQYWLSNDGQTLQGRTGSTDGTDGTLIFQIDLNQNPVGTDTYTVTMFGTIDNGGGTSFDDLTSTSAGNVDFRGVGADDPVTTIDLLLSASTGAGTGTSVNTDSDSIGSANQSMDDGETVRIDFVTDLTEDTTAPLTPSGFNYGAHVSSNQFLGTIPQVQGNDDETVAFTVWALDTTNTDATEPDRNPADGFSDSSITEITEVTVIGYDTGEETPVTVDITGFTVGVFTAVAYGISVRPNADGSVTFSGIQATAAGGDQYGFSTGSGDFNAVAVQAEAAGTGGSTEDSFDLGVFSIGVQDSGDPINLLFDLQLTDSDGDTVVVENALDITIAPDTDTLAATPVQEAMVDKMELFGSDNDNPEVQLKSMNAANTNTVFLGAVAAAGLTATPAAAETHDFRPVDLVDTMDMPAFSTMSAMKSADPVSRDILGNEALEAAGDSANAAAATRSHDGQAGSDAGLSGADAGTDGPALSQLSGGTDIAAKASFSEAAAVADAIAMPSAEALAALGGPAEAGAKVTGEVGRAIADALAGGEHGPNIDAMLDQLAVGGHAPAVAEMIAKDAGAVPAWDMAVFADYGHANSAYTMDVLALHPDAGGTAAV